MCAERETKKKREEKKREERKKKRHWTAERNESEPVFDSYSSFPSLLFATIAGFLNLVLDTQTWSKVKTRGSVPSKRYGHTAVVLGDSMYIFGGIDQYTSTRSHTDKQVH